MSITIREFLGDSNLQIENVKPMTLTEGFVQGEEISENSIMVDIECVHVGLTKNFTYYTENALRRSINSWTNPYNKPLILHHNEKDGKIIGRVLSAEYTDVNTRSGTGALVATCNVPDKEGIEGIKDGRLKTVSVGVTAHDVRCSICDHLISSYGECEHERGSNYDGELCYWIIDDMEAKELSYVIVPSDRYAHNIKIYSPKNKRKIQLKEGDLEMSKVNELKENAEVSEVTGQVTVNTIDPTVKEIVTEETEEEKAKVEDATEGPKEETKEEPKDEEEVDVEKLKTITTDLKNIIKDLETEIEEITVKLKKETDLRAEVEEELVSANIQLKEFSIMKVNDLRESLGKSVLSKEVLVKRSHDSLMDTIVDLTEELHATKTSIDIKESKTIEVAEEKAEDKVKEKIEIGKAITEALIDENKDTSTKNKKSIGMNVKESAKLSNKEYEDAEKLALEFYNI